MSWRFCALLSSSGVLNVVRIGRRRWGWLIVVGDGWLSSMEWDWVESLVPERPLQPRSVQRKFSDLNVRSEAKKDIHDQIQFCTDLKKLTNQNVPRVDWIWNFPDSISRQISDSIFLKTLTTLIVPSLDCLVVLLTPVGVVTLWFQHWWNPTYGQKLGQISENIDHQIW